MRTGALRELTDSFVKTNGDFGVEVIEAAEVDFGRLSESVSSLPLLAPRRLVILQDPGSQKSLNENIEKLLDAVADTTDLVLIERKFDKRSVLYRTLKKRAEVTEFNELDEKSLPSWLVSEAKKRGGTLSLSDARYLVMRVGLGQLNASNELDKLILYSPEVTRETIDLLTDQQPQSTVFDLLEAAFSDNKNEAIRLYQDQRKQQVEPQAIMGMIAWQVHILAVVKANEKLGAGSIAQSARLNPYVVRKTLALMRGQNMAEIKRLVKKTLQLDARLKSEAVDADEAVQHYLLTL